MKLDNKGMNAGGLVLVGNYKVTHVVLAAVKIAGILALAAVAPNSVQLLKHLPKSKSRTCYAPVYVDKTTARLIKRGLLEVRKERGGAVVRLSHKGHVELLRYQLRDRRLDEQNWDGKWRILVFDISENKRQIRDLLRNELIGIGFVRLQNSVWVNPYECDEISVLLKTNLELGKDMLYMTVERLENDGWLKKRFALK